MGTSLSSMRNWNDGPYSLRLPLSFVSRQDLSKVPNRAFCLRELAVESTSGGLDPLVDLVRSTALPVAGVAAKAENEGISCDVR
ncbi:hypothetical protein FRX31_011088 [Thalictrum thalictroides]|uniref:Uncharacterized protein n=1 Tax=Thalictrum thalictroides TaxID=46969 RepID=A0A7J6WS93_THATH|nr:hypothetical protein FRX31_012450 [Thalictrum thalictroides]KAF5199325.1 hypothetical protein FRX31_011088 [Thalictrum thalictroides]